MYSKNLCKMATLKKTKKNGFQDQLLLNAGQKYCRMLPLLTCRIPVVSMFFQSEMKTLWILDQMARFKSQLIWNLHFFQKRINLGSAGQWLKLSIGHR